MKLTALYLAYNLLAMQPETQLQISQHDAIEGIVNQAVKGCERTRKILEKESRSGEEISSIRYVYRIPPDEARSLLPSSYGLLPYKNFSGKDISVRFLKYENSQNDWNVAVYYRTENREPISIYIAQGRIIEVGKDKVQMLDIPDLNVRLKRNKENVFNDFNLRRLAHNIENAFYSCDGQDRINLEENFKNASPLEGKQPDEPIVPPWDFMTRRIPV